MWRNCNSTFHESLAPVGPFTKCNRKTISWSLVMKRTWLERVLESVRTNRTLEGSKALERILDGIIDLIEIVGPDAIRGHDVDRVTERPHQDIMLRKMAQQLGRTR